MVTSKKSIEVALGFSFGEVEKRKAELRKRSPGAEYLEIRLKEFEAQPWPFLLYFVHWSPQGFTDEVHSYECYDGALNSKALMEKLREYYVMVNLLSDFRREDGRLRVVG